MFEFQHHVRRFVAGLMSPHSPPHIRGSGADSSADWLPPVLGPGDWSLGMMADRSAGWYFDRS